jgi:hypothetical protein
MSEVVINNRITLEQWANITIKEWLKKIDSLGINRTGALSNSFESTVVTNSGGDMEKIVFAFDYYGKMVDWGVGNGVPSELRDALLSSGLSTRHRKEWYKQFYHELAVLKYLYIEKLQIQGQAIIINTIGEK